MGTPNWAKLVAEGRAKDIGIPWTDEETNAIYKLQIPVDYVRDGIITLDDYAKELEKEVKEGKRLSRMEMNELFDKANSLYLKITPDVTKSALVKLIETALERKEAEARNIKAVAKVYEQAAKEEAKAIAQQEKLVKQAAKEEAEKESEEEEEAEKESEEEEAKLEQEKQIEQATKEEAEKKNEQAKANTKAEPKAKQSNKK